jgi:outer membrane lipase/esterase
MMKSMKKLAQCAAGGWGVLLALCLLASCGGGSTRQITPFAPTRLLVFGDEMSVLTKEDPKGRKYSVNALGTDAVTISCSTLPLWTQVLANTYLFAFEECNPNNLAVTVAKIYAHPGAKADDFVAQVAEARLAVGGAFNTTDLATVLLGENDVLDLYKNQYLLDPTTTTYNAIINELTARGTRLGRAVNELTSLGPKVILSTMPLINLTPYALKQAADRKDPNILTVLLDFSNTFNTALRVTIVNNGQYIGLVELDALMNAGVSDPGRYGLTNVVAAACSVPLPDCSTSTLVTGASSTTWLWASDVWMSSTAHLNLGNFARGRALGNPF